jgi:adenylyltransferase/sulfurtransferase
MTPEALKRYQRHISLSEVGKEGQEKLKSAKVLVVGAGGLGCPVLQYLTAAGVGMIGIVDFDKVEESNLQRQVLYETADVGKYKALIAAEKLSRQNPFTEFKIYREKLSQENVLNIFQDFDIIVDGSDNFPTRYLVNDACVILDKPLVFGSIYKFEGHVSVFNFQGGPTYRCLFPDPPSPEDVPNCSQVGVIGVLPGLIGCYQANEVIKMILGIGEILTGKLFILDTLKMTSQIMEFKLNSSNLEIKGFANYEEFCSPQSKKTSQKESITVEELKKEMEAGEVFLLDVREAFETEICSIGGINIPMNQIPQNIEKIPTNRHVVVYCHHGMRGDMIVKFLKKEFGYSNLVNLEGGIHAWALHIDPEMEKY